jgi:hypothetical protein
MDFVFVGILKLDNQCEYGIHFPYCLKVTVDT